LFLATRVRFWPPAAFINLFIAVVVVLIAVVVVFAAVASGTGNDSDREAGKNIAKSEAQTLSNSLYEEWHRVLETQL
jgi:ABC-type cobalt transport system substrate-binding protein